MRINTNCFDGYLTDKCHECQDWKDGYGDDGHGDNEIGCGSKYPIAKCPAWAEGGVLLNEKDMEVV